MPQIHKMPVTIC